jgi:hypothetical protein
MNASSIRFWLCAISATWLAGCRESQDTVPDSCLDGEFRCGEECVVSCALCTGAQFYCGGVCVEDCGACDGSPDACGTDCTNLELDSVNCAACGHSCDLSGEMCATGECVCRPACDQRDCGEDPRCGQSCGTCSDTFSCDEHQRCSLDCGTGRCYQSSASPDCCDGVCVSLEDDPIHCGSCETRCPTGQDCKSGLCCPAYMSRCEDQCVDTWTDAQNCGSCGHACAQSEVCCDTACVDTSTDAQNCGQCGFQCYSSQYCDDGICRDG